MGLREIEAAPVLLPDCNGRGAARDKPNLSRSLIYGNPNGNALGETHPAKRRVHVGEQSRTEASFAIFNAAGDAFHMAGDILVLSHEMNGDLIADMDEGSFVSSK